MAKREGQIKGEPILEKLDADGHVVNRSDNPDFSVLLAGVCHVVIGACVFLVAPPAGVAWMVVGGACAMTGGGIELSHKIRLESRVAWREFKSCMKPETKKQCEKLKQAWETQYHRRKKLIKLLDKVREWDAKEKIPDKIMKEIKPFLPGEQLGNQQNLEEIKNALEEEFWSTRYVELKLYEELSRVYKVWQHNKEEGGQATVPEFQAEIKGLQGVVLYSKDNDTGLNPNYRKDFKKSLGAKMNKEFFAEISQRLCRRHTEDSVPRNAELEESLKQLGTDLEHLKDIVFKIEECKSKNNLSNELKKEIAPYLPEELKFEEADLEQIKKSLQEQCWAKRYVMLKLEKEKKNIEDEGYKDHKEVKDENGIVIYNYDDEDTLKSDYLAQVKKMLRDSVTDYAKYFQDLCQQENDDNAGRETTYSKLINNSSNMSQYNLNGDSKVNVTEDPTKNNAGEIFKVPKPST